MASAPGTAVETRPSPVLGVRERARELLSLPYVIPLACLMVAVVRRLPAWDPASLFLDDQWMGLVLKFMSAEQIRELNPPSPIGFVAVARWTSQLAPDLEWPLQVVPALFGLVYIPLFYGLLRRVVARPLVLALACLWAASHAGAELYSMRVKHYSLDMTACILQLALTIDALRRQSTRPLWLLIALALVSAAFSFVSLFVALACVHALAADALLRSYQARRTTRDLLPRAAGAMLFDVACVFLHASLLAGQSGPANKAFWQNYFLHFDSLSSVLSFIGKRLLAFPMYAMSPLLVVLLPFVYLGARKLLRDAVLKPLAWAWLALLAGLLLAAALQIYPMGADRTGLFAYPLFWLLAAVGAERALEVKTQPSSLRRRRLTLALSAYVVAACLLRPRVEYSDALDRQTVEDTLRIRRDGDAVLAHHFGLVPLGYYAGLPLRFVASDALSQKFEAWPELPDLFVLPLEVGGVTVRQDPALANPDLERLYRRGPARILYLSTHATEHVDEHVIRHIELNAYRLVERIDHSPRARLVVFERAS